MLINFLKIVQKNICNELKNVLLGLGKLSPNMLLMGFRQDWLSDYQVKNKNVKKDQSVKCDKYFRELSNM